MTGTFGRRALLIGTLLLTCGGAARAEVDTLAKVRTAGVLVVGNGAAFPPFEFVDDGKLGGYDIEMGNEIGRRLGVRVEWQSIEFAGLIAGLTSGRVDALITAMTYTPERAQRIAFSTPYYRTGIAAAFRPTVALAKPEDLAGKVVGVQGGTAGEKFVRDQYADKVKELMTYNEFPLAMRDLELGRTEVVVNTLPVLRYDLARANHAGLKVTDVWDGRDVGINTRPTDTTLMAEINRILAAMKDDGYLAGLDRKWFGTAP
ncbi:MAG: ABC-type transporter, periplasmic subunit family 3 [Rhodospirillales bacterium]|nr:ABC-type transporter, periplasmic subunit family 3 [Rhodospirillales bacterium]